MKIIYILLGLLYGFFGAMALELKPFSYDLKEKMDKSGELYFIHFFSDWCPTCRSQEQIFNKLMADPNMGKNIKSVILVANNDTELQLKKDYLVPSQSFVLGLKNGKEYSRSVGITIPDKLIAQLQGQTSPNGGLLK